jgi:predicted nucleic acid-binding protein
VRPCRLRLGFVIVFVVRLPAAAVAERLAAATATSHHAFWPDAVSMLDAGRIAWNAVLGSRQVTDVYLLALAAQQDGRLVTLDRAVPLKAVPGSKARHLVVI